jgi:uncharacterized membrane protein
MAELAIDYEKENKELKEENEKLVSIIKESSEQLQKIEEFLYPAVKKSLAQILQDALASAKK